MTDVAGGTTSTFTGIGQNCTGAGNATVDGFAMESTGDWCYNHSANFGFVDNGNWNGLPLVGDTSGSALITVNLGGLYLSVGGFMNYATSGGEPFLGTPIIEALDINGDVLESYNLAISAPISTPAFLRFGASFLAISSLTLDGDGGSTVPEPSTGMILGGALVALGLAGRKVRK